MLRFLSHNLGWKLIALVAATLVWMALKPGTPPRTRLASSRTFRQVPVALLTAPGERPGFWIEPAAVDIEVSGAPEVLPRLHARDLRAFVDLTATPQGRPLRLRVEVHTPSGITLGKVIPAQVVGHTQPSPVPQS